MLQTPVVRGKELVDFTINFFSVMYYIFMNFIFTYITENTKAVAQILCGMTIFRRV